MYENVIKIIKMKISFYYFRMALCGAFHMEYCLNSIIDEQIFNGCYFMNDLI